MYVCRTQTDLSFPAIARAFGGRDHTTVMHAVDKVTELVYADHDVTCAAISQLVHRLKAPR